MRHLGWRKKFFNTTSMKIIPTLIGATHTMHAAAAETPAHSAAASPMPVQLSNSLFPKSPLHLALIVLVFILAELLPEPVMRMWNEFEDVSRHTAMIGIVSD